MMSWPRNDAARFSPPTAIRIARRQFPDWQRATEAVGFQNVPPSPPAAICRLPRDGPRSHAPANQPEQEARGNPLGRSLADPHDSLRPPCRHASCEHVPSPQQEPRPHSPLGLPHHSRPRPRGCLSLNVLAVAYRRASRRHWHQAFEFFSADRGLSRRTMVPWRRTDAARSSPPRRNGWEGTNSNSALAMSGM
jgi:hypothetical protein